MIHADGVARKNDRAQKLSDLAVAIVEAQQLAWRLGLEDRNSREAIDLYCQLDAARHELETIKKGLWRAPAREIGSKRIRL